ncbi:MAG: hypothetical protein ACOVT5_16020 [Armatimonadaceae bacterium]
MTKNVKPEVEVSISTNNELQTNVVGDIAAVVEERPGGVTITTFVGEQPDVQFAEAN